MNLKIFKHYDIRGIASQDFDAADVYNISLAIGVFFKQHCKALKTIVVGRDTRASSNVFFASLSKAFCAQGFNIVNMGVCPTPVVSAWVKHTQNSAGIMITASHNPAIYNGLKIYLHALGGQVWGDNIQKIKQLLATEAEENFELANKPGQIFTDEQVKKKYFETLKQNFDELKNCTLSVGIDCLNGAASLFAQEVFAALGFKNVFFINNAERKIAQPDPTLEENLVYLRKFIAENKMDLGLAFDGDADRFIALDHLGNLVDGDKLIAIFSQDLLHNNPYSTIVVDVKTSDMVTEIIHSLGGQCLTSPTGNPFLQQKAMECQAIFCGEASCHFTFFDSGVKVDDGVYAALRLIKQLWGIKKTLAELVQMLPNKSITPEIIVKYSSEAVAKQCIESVKNTMLFYGAELSDLDGLKARIPQGWGLIRKSNTQPILSLRFEANSLDDLKIIKKYFAKALAELIDKKELEPLVS